MIPMDRQPAGCQGWASAGRCAGLPQLLHGPMLLSTNAGQSGLARLTKVPAAGQNWSRGSVQRPAAGQLRPPSQGLQKVGHRLWRWCNLQTPARMSAGELCCLIFPACPADPCSRSYAAWQGWPALHWGPGASKQPSLKQVCPGACVEQVTVEAMLLRAIRYTYLSVGHLTHGADPLLH